MSTRMINETEIGNFVSDIYNSVDGYQGFDVEFCPKNEKSTIMSRPRIIFEYDPEEKELSVLVWADADSEDASEEIIFDLGKYMNAIKET